MPTFSDTPNWKKREAYEQAMTRSRRKRAAYEKRIAEAQERRWSGVTVRYECPICGGDHCRADHPQRASVFDFSDPS